MTFFALCGSWAQQATYRLQPEDVVEIQLWNDTQINAKVPVGRDGNISAPFVGIIRAQGKTTAELAADLEEEYKKVLKLREPRISVTIVQYRLMRATINGQVFKPGLDPDVRPTDTIMTLIAFGGGLITDRADMRKATLLRGNSRELIPIDLFAMLVQGDTSQNYALEDGDILNVPEAANNHIVVLGAMTDPGLYPYKEPMTVMDALGLAKWEKRYITKFSDVLVIRDRLGQPGQHDYIHVNIVRYVRNGDVAQNIELKPADVIYVNETKNPDIDRIAAIADVFFILNNANIHVFGK